MSDERVHKQVFLEWLEEQRSGPCVAKVEEMIGIFCEEFDYWPEELEYDVGPAVALAKLNRVGLARRRAQETSRMAARAVAPRTGTQRWAILCLIGEAHSTSGFIGLTRDQIASWLAISPNTVRPRVKELIDGGFVRVADSAGKSREGRDAERLALTTKGLHVYATREE